MGVEVERRFLVLHERLPAELFASGGVLIEQVYLGKDPWVRVRRQSTVQRTGLDHCEAELTIKGRGTVRRPEFNYPIPVADSYDLEKLARFGSVTKVRRRLDRWEIDAFRGALAGLWLAEIELAGEDETFDRPDWLGREVTEDLRYSNAYMADHGMP